MKRLGYTRYVAQGGDWGAIIVDVMATQGHPELIGIHSNMPGTVPPDIDKALQTGNPLPSGLSADETRAREMLAFTYKHVYYAYYMASRPQTQQGGIKPSELQRHDLGDWTMETGFIALNKANGRIAYRFHARDLHLVMGPVASGAAVRFRVLIDGKPPGAARGVDVDEQGNGTVTGQRLYQLVRQPEPIADRTFEIEFLGKDVQAFVFTFG